LALHSSSTAQFSVIERMSHKLDFMKRAQWKFGFSASVLSAYAMPVSALRWRSSRLTSGFMIAADQ
jgi:hypothetical protein